MEVFRVDKLLSCFLAGAAAHLHPLHAICPAHSGDQLLVWTDAALTAFLDAKTLSANASLLVHPFLVFHCIMCPSDASDTGIGAVLEQFQYGSVLCLISASISPSECRCSAFDMELFLLPMH